MTEAPAETTNAPGAAGAPGGASGGGGSARIGSGGTAGAAPATPAVSRAAGGGGGGGGAGRVAVHSDHMLISQLADNLSRLLDRPVLDRTGLTGKYKVDLEWQRDEAASDVGLPTIFGAIQQLGLKLEPKKSTLEMIVVDSIDKTPVEN